MLYVQLRYLQTLNSISAENNSTVIFPVPIDIMNQLMNSNNNRQQQFPVFIPQQQQQQPLQTQPIAAQSQGYPKSSLKKPPAPAPIHQQHQRLAQQKTGRRSIKKSKVWNDRQRDQISSQLSLIFERKRLFEILIRLGQGQLRVVRAHQNQSKSFQTLSWKII